MVEGYFNYISTSSDEDLITFFIDWRENYAANGGTIDELAYDYALSIKEAKELMLAGADKYKAHKSSLLNQEDK